MNFWICWKHYKQIRNECANFVLHNVKVIAVDTILKNLVAAKDSGIDQIFAICFKDGAPIIATHLVNIWYFFFK